MKLGELGEMGVGGGGSGKYHILQHGSKRANMHVGNQVGKHAIKKADTHTREQATKKEEIWTLNKK